MNFHARLPRDVTSAIRADGYNIGTFGNSQVEKLSRYDTCGQKLKHDSIKLYIEICSKILLTRNA